MNTMKNYISHNSAKNLHQSENHNKEISPKEVLCTHALMKLFNAQYA